MIEEQKKQREEEVEVSKFSFQPNIKNKRNQNKPKRTLEEFIEDQKKFCQAKQEKLQTLVEQQEPELKH